MALDLTEYINPIEESKNTLNENSSIEEIDKKIEQLAKVSDDMNTLQLGVKVYINSCYGALAAPYFIGYNPRIAEAITLQGQDVIHFASQSMEDYFHKLWPIDKKAHKALGVKVPGQVLEEVTRYGDTDSCYITFQEPIYNSIYEDPDNHIDPLNFVIKLYEVRLEDYLNHRFEKYAEPWHTKNLQNFELETISKTMILLAKKHYVGDKVYSDGIISDSLQHIKLTGVEVVQSSTPAFARVELLEIIKWFLKDGKKLDYKKFVNYLKDLKKKFISSNIADISFGSAIGDLEKGVMLEYDRDGNAMMKVNNHCPVHVRGAGYHNVLLSNSEYKKKYNLIRSGDKVKYYYVKDDTQEKPVFSFLPGNFPYEYAPEVDYDLMFEKVFINPINRFLIPMGFNEIPGNLVVTKSLF